MWEYRVAHGIGVCSTLRAAMRMVQVVALTMASISSAQVLANDPGAPMWPWAEARPVGPVLVPLSIFDARTEEPVFAIVRKEGGAFRDLTRKTSEWTVIVFAVKRFDGLDSTNAYEPALYVDRKICFLHMTGRRLVCVVSRIENINGSVAWFAERGAFDSREMSDTELDVERAEAVRTGRAISLRDASRGGSLSASNIVALLELAANLGSVH